MYLHHTTKRQWGDNGYSGAGSARWAFFAIFIVLIIIVIIGTIRVNKKRSQRGVQPLYGTRWITPPSYYQSQHQYNQSYAPGGDAANNYVPRYTEEANEYDMGYYDSNGKFHPNPNAQGANRSSIAIPEDAHERLYSTNSGAPVLSMPNVDSQGTPNSASAYDRSPGQGHDSAVPTYNESSQDRVLAVGAPLHPPPPQNR